MALRVSSTVDCMPFDAAIAAMSLASNSHAASGPVQPPYALAATLLRPMCSERPFGAAAFAGGVFAAVLLAGAVASLAMAALVLLRFPLLIVYFLVS